MTEPWVLFPGGLSKGLMERAFPAEARPDYLQDEQFCRWTPDETWYERPLPASTSQTIASL